MSNSVSRRGFMAFAGAAIAAIALTLAFVPNAFAASFDDPDISISTESSTGNLDQHVVVTVDYGTALIPAGTTTAALAGNLDITISGYDITSADYNRPLTASVDGSKLILDIGNRVDASGNAAFTAIYGGIITIDGAPGVSNGLLQPAGALDVTTVIPTGMTINEVSGEGSNNVTATVDHDANVRGMVHIGIYKEVTQDDGTTALKPVNANQTGGSIGIGTYTIHAHNFTEMTTSDLAASVRALSITPAPGDEGTTYTLSGSGNTIQLTSSNPNDKLHIFVVDDTTLSELGQDYNLVVENSGIMPGYEPGGSLTD